MIIRIVVPRNRIESRTLGLAAINEEVGHTHDGRRIQATAEFRKDGPIGAKPALDGRGQESAKMLRVFCFGAVADFLVRIEIPIPADNMLNPVPAGPEKNT